jgi:hypothetical protein
MITCTKDLPVTHEVRIAVDAVVGLRWSKSSEQHEANLNRRGSFDFAPQALCHAIDLWGVSLRMTTLWDN